MPVQDGVIKSCILPGGICVSFSNSPDLAERDFLCFSKTYPNGANFGDVIAYFERASALSGNDYLIAFSRNPKLVKIADGRRVKGMAKTQWIGDKKGYELFRKYEAHTWKNSHAGRAVNAVLFADEIKDSPASELYSVMRSVVGDKEAPSVGGFVCVISDRIDGFRQSVYSDMLYDWPSDEKDDFILNPNDQIDFGVSGENDEYSVSQISTGYLNANVAAFYLLKAKKLFLFEGNNNGLPIKCTVSNGVAPTDIAAKLNEHFCADLHWLMMVTAAAGRKVTRRRFPLITDGPSGVQFGIICHANTMPAAVS